MTSSRNVQSPQRLQARPQLSRSKPLLSQASPQTLVPHLAAITMAALLHRKMLLPMSGPKAHKCGSRMPAFTDVRETFLMRHAKHTLPTYKAFALYICAPSQSAEISIAIPAPTKGLLLIGRTYFCSISTCKWSVGGGKCG